ncbi:MAG TPA: hypothetical protein VF361_03735 [Candidatus Limnocylindrales bacterium]
MADSADRTSGVGDDPAPQKVPPQVHGVPSADGRKDLLARHVFELTRENRAALRSQGDFEAVLVRGKPTNHLVMFVTLVCIMAAAALGGRVLGDLGAGALAAILLGGAFAMGWLVLALTGGEEIERLSIDQRGAIASVKSGRSVDARGDFIRIAAPSVVLLVCAFLAVSLARDIVNPPPPNCSGNAAAIKDSDVCLALPNLGGLLGGPASCSPTASGSLAASGSLTATCSPAPSGSPATSGSPSAGGNSASGESKGWTVGSEKVVERLVRSLQLLFVTVVAVAAAVFLAMMLAGEWVFAIRPVRRRRGDS